MISLLLLRLKSVRYSGQSIGKDIRLDIDFPEEKHIRIERRISVDNEYAFDHELVNYRTESDHYSLPITLTITELDAVWSDTGQSSETFSVSIDTAVTYEYVMRVRVQERRFFFWKRNADFTVLFTAEVRHLKRIPTVDDPKWTEDFADDSEQMILARAIFGEARGTSKEARMAVAWSIRNRVSHPHRFGGGTYHAVILKPFQYSAFSATDSNRRYVEDPLHTGNSIDAGAWRECYDIAVRVIKDEIADPTYGSDHYHDPSAPKRSWMKSEYFKAKIEPFSFYDVP